MRQERPKPASQVYPIEAHGNCGLASFVCWTVLGSMVVLQLAVSVDDVYMHMFICVYAFSVYM